MLTIILSIIHIQKNDWEIKKNGYYIFFKVNGIQLKEGV